MNRSKTISQRGGGGSHRPTTPFALWILLVVLCLLQLPVLSTAAAAANDLDDDHYSTTEEHKEDGHHESHPATAVVFPWFCEIIGVIIFFVLTRYFRAIPFTAVMFLVGTFMGIGVTVRGGDNDLAISITQWANIDGHVLLLVFLPGLLFKDAFEVNFHLFVQSFGQLIIMAFPMVLAGTALVALVAYYIFPYGWSWFFCMTFGSILAATDPVAISVLLNEGTFVRVFISYTYIIITLPIFAFVCLLVCSGCSSSTQNAR